ncbi:M16 family metallopeptidase, partial [Thermoproteota archaeon]
QARCSFHAATLYIRPKTKVLRSFVYGLLKMYKITKFKNNLTLVTHYMPKAYSVAVGVWLKVGARYEEADISGISHVLEHMVFKGSKKHDGNTIKRQIEGRGGLLNGFTSEELTCYLAKVPHKIAQPTFNMLLDMALHPIIKPNELNREKAVIIEEIKMYKDLPPHIAQEELDQLIWPNHPLGRNIAGSVETVSSLSKEKLQDFQSNYYRPQNMVVVFAGNIKHSQAIDFIHKSMETKKAPSAKFGFNPFKEGQKEPNVKTIAKDIEQTRLAMGFTAYPRAHPKRFILLLLNIILGGNMSSRLFDEIREKEGLAYAIASHYKRLADTGVFYIVAGLDNNKIDLALELTLKELSKLTKSLVPGDELTRAKEFCLGQLAMGLEDSLEHMAFLGEAIATTGKVQDFNQIKRDILKVNPASIRAVAQEIFLSNRVNIALVGPIKDFNAKRCLGYIGDSLR